MYRVFIRQFCWFFLVIIGIGLLPIMSGHAYGGGKFSDYFTDGDDAGWTQINRDWSVGLGRYFLNGGYKHGSSERDGYSVTHVGDKKWRNYKLSATFDTTNAAGLPTPDVHNAEFLIHVREMDSPGLGGSTCYRISVWAIGSGDPRSGGSILPEGLVQIMKYVKGSVISSTEIEHSNTAIGTNAIVIRTEGNEIQITINGENILSWKDENKPIRYGGIGVGAIWEAEAWFDNVIVGTP